MIQQPLERQRTPAPAERTGPCPLLHDEAPAREPPGIRHAAPEPPIDAARAPVPDPCARDGVHAADSSGVRVCLPVLEGFPVDLGQPGTDVKTRFNRVHDAGGGARRPPRARMLSDSPSRPSKPFRTRDATFHAPYPTHPVKNIIFDLVMRNPG